MLALGLCALASPGRAARAPGESAAPRSAAIEATPAEADQEQTQTITGWTLLGFGAAGFVAAVVTGALALQQSAVLDRNCVDGQCAPADHAGVDLFYALRTSSTACLAASAPVLVASFAVLLTAPQSDDADATTTPARAEDTPRRSTGRGARLGVAFGPGAISLGGQW
jgi:hypothetical protein